MNNYLKILCIDYIYMLLPAYLQYVFAVLTVKTKVSLGQLIYNKSI